MRIDTLITARDRVLAADRAGLGVNATIGEVLAALHTVARFGAGTVLLTDNDSMLPFGGVVEGYGDGDCVPFWDNELLDPDFIKFNALARSADPVATLSDATDGDLSRSPRYQKLLRPLGGGDELRAAFLTGTTCWAVGSLVRPADAGDFTSTEIDAVRELVPVIARALRLAVIRRDGEHAHDRPAMVVVAAAGTIETTTHEADLVLADFPTTGVDGSAPVAVLAAARRAKNNRSTNGITLRARGESGRWYKIHASPLGDDGRVAVVLEPARAADLVPILLDSYGLTERESDVVLQLARGLSTKEIAAELYISRHTVNDYIKVIFAKCEVASRGELVAKLFSAHLLAGHDAAVTHR